jgi:hypothetical protein
VNAIKPEGTVFVPDAPVTSCSSDTCPTVFVVSDAGPLEINLSDFNPSIHTLYDGEVIAERPTGRYVHP